MNMPDDIISINTAAKFDLSKLTFSVKDILKEIELLRSLVEEETNYLQSVNLPELQAIAPKKEKLVNSISAKLTLIKRNRQILTDLDSSSKGEVLKVEERLNETLDKNFKSLSKAKRMNELMISIIAKSVKKAMMAETGIMDENKANKETFSIVYNEKI
ncbi:MAG: hypothetical protein ACK5BE_02480 [Alphaproteobacteria bacterium]|jgi:hypothetical protein